jgi:hypothetical protein
MRCTAHEMHAREVHAHETLTSIGAVVDLSRSELPKPSFYTSYGWPLSTEAHTDLYLLAPKLVFHKLRSRQIDHPLGQGHQSNGRFIWGHLCGTEAILIAALGNLWLLTWCSSLH